ncbi:MULTISPECIES: ABC transporter permease [unclassified Actinomyces]|uniref:ABC transporter permease n=1 Tax=unclassified Actinomyces TaxID=2609248 RepID=UPI0020175C23|nr:MULTISPECIES: ABC transporter permease [unclassified Actinomyces]MCL3777139.1 ABC transporter permease [Actinomyces sp. AC-20-1]MCL3788945.1 ABC transporter permease [Actinomyces sp. 187325]MCL3791325.1 ABC transporter permease [Actinomyces sp. 186855]MCL3794156.1 ABC transporter permease [Actinomyces sp. 217892]
MSEPTPTSTRASSERVEAADRERGEQVSLLRRVTSHHLFGPVLAVVVLLIACQLASPGFLSITIQDGHLFGQVIDIMRAAVTPMLLGLGMCLVIATAGVDLSVGAVMAISLAVSLTFLDNAADPASPTTVVAAVVLGLAIGLAVGVFNGFLVSVLDIQPFIATMILMVAGRGIAMLITKAQITTVTSAPFKAIGSGFILGLPTPVVIGAVVFLVLALFVRRTALGMLVESIGVNAEASRISGVQSRRVMWLVYVLCGLLAGLAGLVYGAPTMAADANNIGLMKEMDAILCVVIGGTKMSGGKFFLGGTVVGALVLTTIERAVVIFHIPATVTPLFKAIVVIVVVIAQAPQVRERLTRHRLGRTPAGTTMKEVAA